MQNDASVTNYDTKTAIQSEALALGQSKALQGWLICGLAAVFYFYEYLLRVSPAVMTTDLMLNYHISAAGFGILSGVYMYIYSPLQLFVGLLMDRYGPRILLLQACAACVIGTYLFACSHSLMIGILGRFLVGFGSAFAFVGVLKLAIIWLPPKRFAIISGMAMALGKIGGLTGVNLLTLLVARFGWQNTCHYAVVLGAALLALMLMFIQDGFRSGHSASTGQQVSSMTKAFSGLMQILKTKQMWVNGAIGCLLYLPTVVFADLWGPMFLKQVYHFSNAKAAGVVSCIYLGWAIGGFMVGAISNKLQQRRLPITIGSIVAASLLSFVFFSPRLSALSVSFVFLVFGIFSSVQVLVFAIGREISSSESAGTAIALTNMFIMIGGALLQPVIGIVLDLLWDGTIVNGLHVYSSKNFQIALSVLPAGLLLSVILSFFLKESFCRVTHGK
jgi:predicted MFS family arabinose efflux permease